MKKELKESLRILVRAYYDYQRERIGLDGRLGVKKDGQLKKKAPPRDDLILAEIYKRRDEAMAMEETIQREIAREVKKHPLWDAFLKHVKGCGETMAAVLITEIDIHKADTVSKIWQYAGLNPGLVRGKVVNVKGKIKATTDLIRGDKKTKGYICPYNQFLKAKLLGVLGKGFLMASSEYRAFYDNMRTRLESRDWGNPSDNPSDKSRPKAGHQHNAALRYMVKMFLIDLYVAWRTLEGLPIRKPYAVEYLGKHSQFR